MEMTSDAQEWREMASSPSEIRRPSVCCDKIFVGNDLSLRITHPYGQQACPFVRVWKGQVLGLVQSFGLQDNDPLVPLMRWL